MNKNKILKLVIISLLICLNIIFSRIVSISEWNFKISFTFVTYLIAGYLYGPLWGMVVGGVGDFIGSILFPIGAYNPLFTITAILNGLVYGLFMYKNDKTVNIVITIVISQLVISLLLNTWFINIVYDTDYLALLITRITQSLIMLPIEFITIKVLLKVLPRILKRYEL